jgi:DNA repair protein RecO (recombination protein O)
MAYNSDMAVVLRRLDYSETSQIITVLTRHQGKVSLIAKGIKRGTKTRFAMGLDLLELGEVVWSSRPGQHQDLMTMTEWKQRRAFSGLRENLKRLYCAEYAAEITAALTKEQDPHESLFDALVACLDRVAGSPQPLPELCRYQQELLVAVGFMPQAERCIGCGHDFDEINAQRLHFSSHEGGFICRDCESHHVEKRLSSREVLEAILAGSADTHQASRVFDLFNYHISHLMGKEPRLAEFVYPAAERRKQQPPQSAGG